MGELKLIDKLNKIQTELNAPKKQYNSFGKYYFRNCDDILEAVKPLCKEYNCSVLLSDKVNQVGERYYIECTATLIDGSNEKIEVTASARESLDQKGMQEQQVTGSTSSYARKYALNGLFALDDNKDADTTNTHNKQTASPTNSKSDLQQAIDILNSSKDLEELKKNWDKGKAYQKDDRFIRAKNKVKAKFEKPKEDVKK